MFALSHHNILIKSISEGIIDFLLAILLILLTILVDKVNKLIILRHYLEVLLKFVLII